MTLAVYPGTFDPITNGHVDILRRSLKIFDRVVVARGRERPQDAAVLASERRAMITDAVDRDPRLEVDAFQGLLVEYCGAAAPPSSSAACARWPTSNTSSSPPT